MVLLVSSTTGMLTSTQVLNYSAMGAKLAQLLTLDCLVNDQQTLTANHAQWFRSKSTTQAVVVVVNNDTETEVLKYKQKTTCADGEVSIQKCTDSISLVRVLEMQMGVISTRFTSSIRTWYTM